jgi:hypothetical protein
MEQAQLAAKKPTSKGCSEAPGVNTENFLDQDLDQRYQVSHSQNEHIDIYSYVCGNQDNPTFVVLLLLLLS